MKQLEDQLKDAFDHFEPEVDPSVWAKVSSQIGTSLTSVNDGGSSVASTVSKGVLSKFAPLAGWISGATAVIIGGALIWNLNSKPAEKVNATQEKEIPVKVEEQAVQQNAPVIKNINQERSAVSFSDNRETQGNKTAVQHTNVLSSSEANSAHNAGENQIAERSAVPAKNNEVADPRNADAQESRSSATSTSTDNTSPNNKPATSSDDAVSKAAKPVLMLNTKGGFAPLAVTVITNQEGKAAEFDFGDGTVLSQSESATHKFEEPGVYTIRCKVAGTDLEGTVEVLGKIGSAFSPNGDGINDLFIISDPQVSAVEINIFDRAGKKIFASKGSEIRWDGKTAGDRFAETGTYFYNIFVTSQNGSTYKQKGTINLFK